MSDIADHKIDPSKSDLGPDLTKVPAATPTNNVTTTNSTYPVVDTNMRLTLRQFRGLMGIPYDHSNLNPNPPGAEPTLETNGTTDGLPRQDTTFSVQSYGLNTQIAQVPLAPAEQFSRPHFLPQRFHRWRMGHNAEAPSSIYFAILQEEKKTQRQYITYDWMIYGALIMQLILSAVLIVLGATSTTFHIPISVIGALQGVLTGILSILKGQGLPIRLIKYMDALRKVREEIEFCERQLRMGINMVTLRRALDLRELYEKVRDEKMKNNPDIWQSGVPVDGGEGDGQKK